MITFYATIDADSIRPYIPAVPIMLPASSFARYNLRTPRLPTRVTERAADSGGFVATFKWGDYRYTPLQYVTWLHTWQPQWAATMDYCCENEITSGHHGIVRERQQKTTEMAHHFWKNYQDCSWAWVPTIQGWEIDDYTRHAQEMKPLITEMQACYGTDSFFRVGIGTLCRRASSEMIRRVALAVAAVLPDIPLHLWGIKLGALQSPLALPEQVASVDSAAWNNLFGRGLEQFKSSGLTQRQYRYTVALPTYIDKFQKALADPKQLILF